MKTKISTSNTLVSCSTRTKTDNLGLLVLKEKLKEVLEYCLNTILCQYQCSHQYIFFINLSFSYLWNCCLGYHILYPASTFRYITKTVRIIAFSRFDEHSTSLFKLLNIIKLCDLLQSHISIFMFKFYKLLPSYFDAFYHYTRNCS